MIKQLSPGFIRLIAVIAFGLMAFGPVATVAAGNDNCAGQVLCSTGSNATANSSPVSSGPISSKGATGTPGASTPNGCGITKMTGKGKEGDITLPVPANCAAIVDTFGYNGCQDAGVVVGFNGPITLSIHLTDGKIRTVSQDSAGQEFVNTVHQLQDLSDALSVAIPAQGWTVSGQTLTALGPYATFDDFVAACGTQVETMYLSRNPNCVYFCDVNGDGKIDAQSVPAGNDSNVQTGGVNGGGGCTNYCPPLGGGNANSNSDNGTGQSATPPSADNGNCDSCNGNSATVNGKSRIDAATYGSLDIPFQAGDAVLGASITDPDGKNEVCTDVDTCYVAKATKAGVVHGGVVNPWKSELQKAQASGSFKECKY